MSIELKETLHLPIWRGFLFAFLVLSVVFLSLEIVARTPFQDYLPLPSVGADSFIFDAKVAYLERDIRENGDIDCLIIGDSMVNNGLDPSKIRTAYESLTEKTLRCFNFGMPALTLDASGPVAQALVNRFDPKLVVFIISPRDFVPKYGQIYRHVATSAWSLQNLGEKSVKGWLVNHSYGYRYFLSLRYWLLPRNRDVMRADSASVSTLGYSALHGYRDPMPEYVPQTEYDFYEESSQAGLSSLLAIREEGVDLIVVDAPVRSDYSQVYLETPQNYLDSYIFRLKAFFAPYAIPFYETGVFSRQIPNDAWYDPMHVNLNGEPVFSAWLGEFLAELYPAGMAK